VPIVPALIETKPEGIRRPPQWDIVAAMAHDSGLDAEPEIGVAVANDAQQRLAGITEISRMLVRQNSNRTAVAWSTLCALKGVTVSRQPMLDVRETIRAGARTVTAILASQDFAANAGTLLGNYVLPVSASGAGQIDRALLTAAIVNTPTKTYDGTTLATLTAGNFALTGFVAGEGAMVTRNAGIYSSANAGARTVTTSLVVSDFAANQGTLLSNYILPAGATGAGLINRADLVVTVTGNPTKPFDGNTSATLGAWDFTIGGFVPGEGAIITETHGNYASARPGTHQVSVSLDPGDYSASQGTLLSNYNLPSVAVGPGEITRSGTACAVPYAADCELNGLFGVPRFYIPYPSAYTPYFARTNGLAGLPGVLRQASVTPIPGGLLIRTGMPTINSPEAILMQGEAGKTFTILFPPEQTPAPLDLEETKP